jgi:hypothetical protein
MAVTLVSLLALMGTRTRWVGVAQVAVAVATLVLSAPFTAAAWGARRLNVRRAGVYHAGLLVVAVAGVLRASGGNVDDSSGVLGVGVLLLLSIALSNSWQLVLTHEADDRG